MNSQLPKPSSQGVKKIKFGVQSFSPSPSEVDSRPQKGSNKDILHKLEKVINSGAFYRPQNA